MILPILFSVVSDVLTREEASSIEFPLRDEETTGIGTEATLATVLRITISERKIWVD